MIFLNAENEKKSFISLKQCELERFQQIFTISKESAGDSPKNHFIAILYGHLEFLWERQKRIYLDNGARYCLATNYRRLPIIATRK